MSGTDSPGITLTVNPTSITSSVSSSLGSGVYGTLSTDWTINNFGYINSSISYGIALGAAGYISNEAGASILGYSAGTRMFRNGTINNFGTVKSTSTVGTGILFYENGQVVNEPNGLISGAIGVDIYSDGKVLNHGSIISSGYGVKINTGYIINSAGGIISAPIAIKIDTAGTIINAGTIKGTNSTIPAVSLGPAPGTELIIDPGSTIIGAISGFGSGDTIDFSGISFSTLNFLDGILSLNNSNGALNTLNLIGIFTSSEFQLSPDGAGGTNITLGSELISQNYTAGINLTALTTTIAATAVVSGQYVGVTGGSVRGWTLENYGTIDQTSTLGFGLDFGGNDNGSLFVTNGTAAVIEGTSGVRLSAGTLINEGTIIGNSPIAPAAIYIERSFGTVNLILDSNSVLKGAISGFEIGDVIDIAGTVVTTVSYSNGTLILENGSNIVGNILLNGNFNTNEFYVVSDQSGGTNILIGPSEILTGSYTNGVVLSAAYTSITNTASVSNDTGIYGGVGRSWTLVNDSTISGLSEGIKLASGYLKNEVGGSISGVWGVDIKTGTFVNQGDVQGSAVGFIGSETVSTTLSGQSLSVFNEKSGIISGATAVVAQFAISTIENAGTIESSLGAGGTSVAFSGGRSKLIVDPGSVFIGSISAQISLGTFDTLMFEPSISNVLEFSAGGMAGIFSGIGETVTGFNLIKFDVGSSWSLEGNISGFANGEVINGFMVGDTITIDGFTATSDNYIQGLGLELMDGFNTITLDITGNFSSNSFVIGNSASGTEIVICYLRGTKILTPVGLIAVEDLKIGDPVITKYSGYKKIIWIGTQSFLTKFVKNNIEKIPIQISARSLGPNCPERDLYVSAGHSILLGEKLILAKNLVNGVSIVRAKDFDEINYYAIEIDTHDCVFAEGCWSETYADGPGLRSQFHNVSEFYGIYPDYKPPENLQLCRPRPEFGLELEVALQPIVARASKFIKVGELCGVIDTIDNSGFVTGWAYDKNNPELPVLLDVYLKQNKIGTVLACNYREDLARAGFGQGRCMFAFNLSAALWPIIYDDIHIYRSTDRAEIYMTDYCRAKIFA